MKECIACAEEIKETAKLCKHCGTRQDDANFQPSLDFSSVEDVWNSGAVLAMASSSPVSRALFAKKTASAEILTDLVGDDDEGVRSSVAENPNTPPEILKTLAKDGDDGVRSSVAENPNTPPEILKSLSKDGDDFVRDQVARNLNTPPEVLKVLAKDDAEFVVEGVAENPGTPSDVLKALAKSDSESIRVSVAQHSNTPPEVLMVLSTDDDSWVRSTVAANPNNTPEILSSLVDGGDETTDGAIYTAVALHPRIDVDLLLKVLQVNTATGDWSMADGNDEEGTDFSLAMLFAQVSRIRKKAQRELKSLDGGSEEGQSKKGEIEALNLVYEYLSDLDPDDSGPSVDNEELVWFLEDNMGSTEYFEEDDYDEDERGFFEARWHTLEMIWMAVNNEEPLEEN